MLELDHVFVMCDVGAPQATALVAFGLREGRANRHVGQGTANRCFFFRNAYLELLWVDDDAAARSPVIAPTRLSERARCHTSGVAPFGVCVRPATALPFATSPYRPPYMPAGAQIDVANTLPHEPLVFATPWGGRPDEATAERRQPLDHPNGAAEITRLCLTRPRGTSLSPVAAALERSGVVTFAEGDAYLAELELDHARAARHLDLRPALPLVLRA